MAKSITRSDARSCQCRKVRIRHEIFFDEPLACLVTLPKFSDSLRLYDRKFFASKRVGRFSVLFKSAHLISPVRSRPNTIFLEGLSIKRLTAALSLSPSLSVERDMAFRRHIQPSRRRRPDQSLSAVTLRRKGDQVGRKIL